MNTFLNFGQKSIQLHFWLGKLISHYANSFLLFAFHTLKGAYDTMFQSFVFDFFLFQNSNPRLPAVKLLWKWVSRWYFPLLVFLAFCQSAHLYFTLRTTLWLAVTLGYVTNHSRALLTLHRASLTHYLRTCQHFKTFGNDTLTNSALCAESNPEAQTGWTCWTSLNE